TEAQRHREVQEGTYRGGIALAQMRERVEVAPSGTLLLQSLSVGHPLGDVPLAKRVVQTMTKISWLLGAILLLTPTAASAQLEEVGPEVVQRIAAAAREAVKSGKLAPKALKADPVWEKAFGYRLGAAAVVVIPDRALTVPPAGQNPLPLAL